MQKVFTTRSQRGFSLVELLAVVLVLETLAAVAIPLYSSQRKSAAGRACKANLAAISSALSAYALRNNAYPAQGANGLLSDISSSLVGAPEGLVAIPACPLNGAAYTYTITNGAATVACPNDANHASFGGVAGEWNKVLARPAGDSLP